MPGNSVIFVFLTVVFESILFGESIDCYVCKSFNGEDAHCEDEFDPPKERNFLVHNCLSYRKSRDSLFPADHCIKIEGEAGAKNVTIRTCALDSGGLTADTEIVRMSHCGHFKINDQEYRGCVKSCSTNGCNFGTSNLRVQNYQKFLGLTIILLTFFISVNPPA